MIEKEFREIIRSERIKTQTVVSKLSPGNFQGLEWAKTRKHLLDSIEFKLNAILGLDETEKEVVKK